MIIYLSKDQLIKINRETVRIHGGNYMPPFNFLDESNLEYLIDSVSADLFGSPVYPPSQTKPHYIVILLSIITYSQMVIKGPAWEQACNF
jgi:hypothetical protein